MDRAFLNKIAVIVKDKPTWDAFTLIMEHQRDIVCKRLEGKPSSEELIRLSAEYTLLTRLMKFREHTELIEKDLN